MFPKYKKVFVIQVIVKQLLFCYLATVVLLFTVLFFIQSKVLFLLFRQQIFLYYKHIYFVNQATDLFCYSDNCFDQIFRHQFCFVIQAILLFCYSYNSVILLLRQQFSFVIQGTDCLVVHSTDLFLFILTDPLAGRFVLLFWQHIVLLFRQKNCFVIQATYLCVFIQATDLF